MRLPAFSFPHISRLLPASVLFLTLWAGFGLVLAVNGLTINMRVPPPNQAKDEAVLGVTASESAELASQFLYWKNLTEEKPDYRDAFVMAATAAYKLKRYEDAKIFINRAFVLDPTSPTVRELQEIITGE